MKKKFIDIETYKNIEKNSLTAVERELQEAAELVGGMLGDTNLEVFCIDESTVTFINSDGNYVQANYEMNKDQIRILQ
jgi:division protein CdvB (Snf7/Vps24/ESCRT-III family)